ncbi:regulatory helix-turn-helix LysR family protein [Trinickia symbiotica]|nr:regulatory helix-turn-helix LysR family protein [Trinickia symbiotica]
MDGFSDLNVFALAARHRNLAAAAREMGVTPPAVSKRLAQLERRLGVRLMNRTTRRLSLTPEGELYLSSGSRILDELTKGAASSCGRSGKSRAISSGEN